MKMTMEVELYRLPKYKEGEVGQEITYTITEDPVDGYISEVDGYDVTNTRSAAVSKVDIGTGEELTGAHFQVLDGAGNIVDVGFRERNESCD